MKRFISAFLLCSLASLSAQAADDNRPNYNYTELSYSTGDFRYGDPLIQEWDQDGFELEGSYAWANNIWIAGTYSRLKGRSDLDSSQLQFRSFTGRLGYVIYPSDVFSVDFSFLLRQDRNKLFDTKVKGWGGAVGARVNVWRTELYGRVDYLADDFRDGYGLDAGGVFRINENFGITLSYERSEYKDRDEDKELNDLRQVQLGLRFTFPRS